MWQVKHIIYSCGLFNFFGIILQAVGVWRQMARFTVNGSYVLSGVEWDDRVDFSIHCIYIFLCNMGIRSSVIRTKWPWLVSLYWTDNMVLFQWSGGVLPRCVSGYSGVKRCSMSEWLRKNHYVAVNSVTGWGSASRIIGEEVILENAKKMALYIFS